MSQLLRPLLPMAALALLLTAGLDIWIRVEPLAMSATLQVVLSLLLVAAIAMLLVVVRRVESSETDG